MSELESLSPAIAVIGPGSSLSSESNEEKVKAAGAEIPVLPKEDATGSGAWTDHERQSMAFAKSTLRFKENLDRVRKKKETSKFSTKNPTAQSGTQQGTEQVESRSSGPISHRERQIRVLRVIQHTLTSIVSLIIATLQSLTYSKYQQTKDIPGAWPARPSIFPTLILLAVAAIALAFDICSLIASFMPHKRIARRAFRLAVRLHYWITGIKTLSYVVAASVCRAGHDMGDNKDLWGWSCSKQGEEMNSLNDAKGNCTGNTVAWVLSILNIAIEILGVIIPWLTKKKGNGTYQQLEDPYQDSGSDGRKAAEKDDRNVADPLLSRYDALDSMGDEVHSELKEPDSESS